MKESFNTIYDHIINSEDKAKMKVLGGVTKAIMYRLMETNPSLAKEYIEQLESVKWCNYLTHKESETITSEMTPSPYWTRSAWEKLMEDKKKEEEPYYNDNALYTTMCMISSDSGDTLQRIGGIGTKEILFDLIYHLAIDKLKDKDKVFNIRKYFNL